MNQIGGVALGNREQVLNQILEADKNFVLWERNLSSFLDSWSSELKWDKVIPLEAELSHDDLDSFEEDLFKELKLWRTRSQDLNYWLASDIRSIIEKFMKSSGANEVSMQLGPVKTDMCRFFHVDNNHLRLLCTYVGQGTLWVPNAHVHRPALGKGKNEDVVLDPLHIHQTKKLDVLILKGAKWLGNSTGGAVHRSPPLQASERRLLLKVDFIS